ncbi:MAG: ferredoxin-type protein NapG [Proteobacteria bacterium]|nr:MAG: ferredoxin-type protein NapG [Pseudomonadota bacterium]
MQISRRNFISALSTLGLCTFGGIVWSVGLDEAVSAPLVLRPPAAKDEKEFLSSCIKCGLCVEACPYDTLKLAEFGSKKPLGTPYFVPREIPCYMCPDIPCVPACPTDALDKKNVQSQKNGKNALDINKAKMGVAVVDEISCVAFWGIQCDACYRACPILGSAIKLEFKRNERTGKHALLMPVVDSDFCTGCGLCEHACITKKAAIFVLPREVALGDVGDHYIKGWDKKDEKRLQNIEVKKQDKKQAVDYLNEGISYE